MGRSHVRSARRSRRLFGLLLFFTAFTATLVAGAPSLVGFAEAAPLKVRVRGTAKLTAHASREQAPTRPGTIELVLSGSLTDDAGQPLALQSVVVRVTREADANDPIVAEGMRAARGCDSPADPAAPSPRGSRAWGVRVSGTADAPEIVMVTDEDGRFCFRAPIVPDRYKAHLVFTPKDGSVLVDGVEREIVVDLTKRSLTLRFDPTPRILQLDAPQTTIEAVATLDDEGSGRASVAPGLELVLANEKEEIAREVTDRSGRARFALPGVRLGPPGPGELRVSFAGNDETARASHTEDVERRLKVAVGVPEEERGELAGGVPEDGIPLLAEVHSSLGPVSEGSVEARIGDVVVGAAPVENGIARLTLTFAAHGEEALVRLRYVPASPWFEPLGERAVRIPIRGPGLLSKTPILLAGLAVLAFFLIGRVSAQKAKPEPLPPKKAEAERQREAKPRMEVVRRAERGDEGWTGRVVDAHEGTPIAGARVWIERGTFEGQSIVASAETDAEGRFVLPGIGPTSGDERLSAEARLHARLTTDLPAPSEIGIALAARRRALLARLVSWARRRGPPFDTRPEPTPGHVRRVASDDASVARWAEALERVAFGPGDVDARAEQEVESLAPEDHRRAGEHESRNEHRDGDARAAAPAGERRRSEK